jgi:di/tricarboxylate transporter
LDNPARYRGTSAYPVTIEELGEFGIIYFNATLIILLIISLYCLYKLWRQHVEIKKKIIWSIIVMVPLLGPLFYGYSFAGVGAYKEPRKRKRIKN